MSDDFLFAEEPEETTPVTTGSWKVLIVDDEPEVHAVTKLALRDFIFQGKSLEFYHAYSGSEARNLISRHPDTAIILLDVVMPGKNGFHVCRQLKAEATTKRIKIILVTSKNQQSDRVWGLKQGADAYLAKPFDAAELLGTIAQCL